MGQPEGRRGRPAATARRWNGSRFGALAVLVFTLILLASALALFGMTRPRGWVEWADAVGTGVVLVAFALLGILITFHRPGYRIAWVCLGFAVVWGLLSAVPVAVEYESAHPGSFPRLDLLAAVADPLWAPGVGFIAFLLLLFPDDRLPSPRWNPLAWLLAGTVTLLIITGWLRPGILEDTNLENPLGVEALGPIVNGPLTAGLLVVLVACLIASAAALLLRYRRARGTERLQLKWLVAAGAVAAVGYALLFVQAYSIHMVWVLIPIAIGMSMHRHRLYDIDRLISRTVVYAVVVGAVALVFIGVIFVVQEILGAEGPIGVAGSTLAAAAVFNPVRRKVQERVDRRFNRSRFDAQRVAEGFAGGLANETDAGQIIDDWLEVVSVTVQPTTIGVWLR